MVGTLPHGELRVWSGLIVSEEETMSTGTGSKRRLVVFGSIVCLGLVAIGGYLYLQHLNSRQSFRLAPVFRAIASAAQDQHHRILSL